MGDGWKKDNVLGDRSRHPNQKVGEVEILRLCLQREDGQYLIKKKSVK